MPSAPQGAFLFPSSYPVEIILLFHANIASEPAKLFDNCAPFRYLDVMQQLLVDHGYPALFFLSFLAATLIPLGSEWLLAVMLVNHRDPLTTVAVATVGNYLGACTTYWLGVYGGPWLIRRVLRIDEQAEARAERFYARYGVWSLLFSWLPVIGDPICLVGGLLRIGFLRFSTLIFAGKLARYATVGWLTLEGVRLTGG